MKKNLYPKALYALILLATVFQGIAQTKATKADQLIQAYVARNQFNGTALVFEHGKIILEKGYGFQNTATKQPAGIATIYQIGSVTKQFTATLILKLAEEGKLSLNDPLSRYYPDFPKGDSISIHQLLSHTAGIYNYTSDAAFMQDAVTRHADEATVLSLFKNKALDFSPGSDWRYSNSGYMLLGYIIEKASGMSYYKAIRKYILDPLGMTNSGFDFARLRDNHKATGYMSIVDAEGNPNRLVDSSVSFAAGALYSTAGDLLKWHKGLLVNTVIGKNSLQKAFTPVRNNYGYGWFIDSLYGRVKTVHDGKIFGFTSIITRVPSDDVAIILLSNAENSNLTGISNSLLALLYDKPYTLPEVKKEILLPVDSLRLYTGLYKLSEDFQLEITLPDDHLYAKRVGDQSGFRLYAEKQDLFFLKAFDASLEFIKNEKGIEQLILRQGGQERVGMKVK